MMTKTDKYIYIHITACHYDTHRQIHTLHTAACYDDTDRQINTYTLQRVNDDTDKFIIHTTVCHKYTHILINIYVHTQFHVP